MVMSTTFENFIQQTGFSPTYAARKILYYPNSRPAQIANALELDISKSDRALMVKLCANKITFKDFKVAVQNEVVAEAAKQHIRFQNAEASIAGKQLSTDEQAA